MSLLFSRPAELFRKLIRCHEPRGRVSGSGALRLAAGFSAALLLAVSVAPSNAQTRAATAVDPREILEAAKQASGGAAWDALRAQHSKVSLTTSGLAGHAERWADMATGRSLLRYELGPIAGIVGYDGAIAWSQDASGPPRAETADVARELAVNAAYRDRLAFWYPGRGSAEIVYRGVTEDDGAEFDVIRITPRGGRLFELWINRQTHLIERLLERDGQQTRTEHYMDFRTVQGVQIPFRVRSTRGDPKYDELVVVDALEYNAPLGNVAFGLPPPAAPDFTFPSGRAVVEVPLEVHNGQLFVRVGLNGKGPYRMLLDPGGANVLTPELAAALGVKATIPAPTPGAKPAQAGNALATIDRVEIGGIIVEHQTFATIDITPLMRRIEGLDDVSGVIGFELFKRFPVTLDYAGSRVQFHDPATFIYTGDGERVAFRFNDRLPEINGTVDGIAGNFDIDPDNRGSLTLAAAFAERNGLVARYRATQEIITGAGVVGRVRARLGRAGSLTIGGMVIDKPVTALLAPTEAVAENPELAGIIGYGILRRFRVTFDYANQLLHFEKAAGFGAPDAFERAGLWIERGPSGYIVVDVVSGGPAALAGLKSGDVIVAINGRSWTRSSLENARAAMSAPAGTKLVVRIAGGKDRTLTLRDLI